MNLRNCIFPKALYAACTLGFFSVLFVTPCRAEPPAADEAFRAQMIRENTESCVQGIEEQADLRATYSHKTVEVYCTCRQRYRADVLALANKENRRGKPVVDEAADYSQKKCVHILLENLEHE